jgi:mannose-1-phosphate guanylyltransferase/mannose-6-phosphate isomerase
MIIHPVILAGGSGTRLWPLSRLDHPKQLLSIIGEATLLQSTVARVHDRTVFQAPTVVTAEASRFIVLDQLRAVSCEPAALILEPEGRNTAPAIAMAAYRLLAEDPEAIMLVMPSDHMISRVDLFNSALSTLLKVVRRGALGTLGSRIKHADTGFGYIEMGEESSEAPGVFEVRKFIEKPELECAEGYLKSEKHLWNAGIFLFKAESYLAALEEHAPQVARAAREAMRSATSEGNWVRPGTEAFLSSPNISIDCAIMEKVNHAAVVPMDMGWSDLGSWDAVWELVLKNERGTAVLGPVTELETENCLLQSHGGPAVMALGVKDLIAIATRDAVLIVPRDRTQDVRSVVDAIRDNGDELHRSHALVHRPWGTYETTDKGERFLTKRIIVKPGAKLSLQMHHHRSEHWIVVSGTAKVTVDGIERIVHENESTYVPAGSSHRLENPGRIPLHLIEVQCGSYLKEDDIVRFEDNYGRAR